MNCSIVRDLLPLYHDEVVSEESRKLVEEHLETCEECKKMLDDIRENMRTAPTQSTEEPLASGFKILKKRLRRKTVATIAASILGAVILVSALTYGVFFYERPVPLSRVIPANSQSINSAFDFFDEVGGCNSIYLFINDEAVYFSIYDTVWTRFFSPINSNMIYLLEAPTAPAAPSAPAAPHSNLPSPSVPPTPPEPPNPFIEISNATRIYYMEGRPSELARSDAALQRAMENAVLIWEK